MTKKGGSHRRAILLLNQGDSFRPRYAPMRRDASIAEQCLSDA
jgi:hypothetical protein